MQLFWGEPLDGIAERIERLEALSEKLGREHAPLEYGLRITTLVRDTSEEAWRDAEAKVAELAGKPSLLLLHNADSAEGSAAAERSRRPWRSARFLPVHHAEQIRR